ncbi:unnamed protein product [Caretta caretta]
MVIEEFFNQTWKERFKDPMSLHALTMFWTFTVSTLALGGHCLSTHCGHSG